MSGLFLKLIYHMAGTVVHLLLLKFSMTYHVVGECSEAAEGDRVVGLLAHLLLQYLNVTATEQRFVVLVPDGQSVVCRPRQGFGPTEIDRINVVVVVCLLCTRKRRRNQCDQMARLLFNIWPFTTFKIDHIT